MAEFTWAESRPSTEPPSEAWCRVFLSDEDFRRALELAAKYPQPYRETFFTVTRWRYEEKYDL